MAYPPFTFLGRGLGIALCGRLYMGRGPGDLCTVWPIAPNQCMMGFQAAQIQLDRGCFSTSFQRFPEIINASFPKIVCFAALLASGRGCGSVQGGERSFP